MDRGVHFQRVKMDRGVHFQRRKMDRGGSILHRGGPFATVENGPGGPFSTVENGPGGTFLGGSIFNLTPPPTALHFIMAACHTVIIHSAMRGGITI